MNIRNAWGFLSFGLVMGLLPLLTPSWFPPTGIDGTSARALWLELMGAVQALLGGVRVIGRIAVPAFIRWLAIVPESVTPGPSALQPVAPVLAFESPALPRHAVFSPSGVRLPKAA